MIQAGDADDGDEDESSTKLPAVTMKSDVKVGDDGSESPDKMTGTTEIYKFIVDVIRRPIDGAGPAAGNAFSVVEGLPGQISETSKQQIPSLTVDQVVNDQAAAVNQAVPQSVKDKQQNLQQTFENQNPLPAGGNPVQVPSLPGSPNLPENLAQQPGSGAIPSAVTRVITITDTNSQPQLPSSPVTITLPGNPPEVPQVPQIPGQPPSPQMPQAPQIPQPPQVPQNIPQPQAPQVPQVPQNLLPPEVQQPLSQVPQVNVPQVPQNIPQPQAPQIPQPPQPPQGVGPISSLTQQVTRPLDQISPPATPPQQIPDEILGLVPQPSGGNPPSIPNSVNQYIPPEVQEYNPANGNSPYSPVAAGKVIASQAEEYVPSEYQNVPNDIRTDIRNTAPISSPYVQPQPSAVSPSYPYNKANPSQQTLSQSQGISYGGSGGASQPLGGFGGPPAGGPSGQPPSGLNFGKYMPAPPPGAHVPAGTTYG